MNPEVNGDVPEGITDVRDLPGEQVQGSTGLSGERKIIPDDLPTLNEELFLHRSRAGML